MILMQQQITSKFQPTEIIIHTTSTNATWSPSLVVKTGDTLVWDVTGDASGSYSANKPTIDLSGNTGTAVITVSSADGFGSVLFFRLANLDITYINVGIATSLTNLWITGNPLLEEVIGLENLVLIDNLRLSNNNFSGVFDLRPFTAITSSACYLNGNNLTSVNTTGLVDLQSIIIPSNILTSLDLSTNVSLKSLQCHINPTLTSLDISNNTNLEILNASSCSITSLDISNNTNLISLFFTTNDITSLDISSNTLLKTININGNNLSVSALNNIILDRYNNGVLTGSRAMNYLSQQGGQVPSATEYTTNDVLNAYNALVSAGWSINGAVPS